MSSTETLERVAELLDVAKREHGFTPDDFSFVTNSLADVRVRDELLGVAVRGEDEVAGWIGNLCHQTVLALGEGNPNPDKAPPATIASIIAFIWGYEEVSDAFLSEALSADEDYNLASLFSQIRLKGASPETVRVLITAALA
jgi:hypothetical protein